VVLCVIAIQQVQSGQRICTDFHLVPRGNFPGSVPKWLSAAVVSQEAICQEYELDEEVVDLGSFWVVDSSIPKEKLGLKVRTLSLFSKTATGMASSSLDPAAARAPGGQAAAAGAPGGQAAAAGAPETSVKIKQEPAAAMAPDDAPPPSKRQRFLRSVTSNEAEEDREVGALEALVKKVQKAAQEGNFWHADKSAVGSVHFWCGELISSCKSSAARAQDPAAPAPGQAAQKKASIIKEVFPLILEKILLQNRIYSLLKHFVQVFEDLEKESFKKPPMFSALQQLSTYELLSDEKMSVGDIDIGQRVTFYSSAVYRDFLEHRMVSRVDAAKIAETPEALKSCIEKVNSAASALDKNQTISVDAARQVAWATSMFHDSVPEPERVVFAMDDTEGFRAARLDFACEFKVSGSFWPALRYFTQIAPVPDSLSWDQFERAASLVQSAQVRKAVSNPIVGAVLDFRSGCLSSCAPELAKQRPGASGCVS